MPTSTAAVATDRGGRYIKQLCSHFSKKAESVYDESSGHTVFEFGEARMTATDTELRLEVSAADEPLLGRVEYVVADHLERFAARDGLTVEWRRDT
ncbi:hypothetical protein LX16_0920 [Stackebrandtia albiflava]|uniref:DUF2218 domain-containing protein n=1 Tax=Stackebrandtia albiflava TaxID=406432 RepID=A0A562VBI7_9ACTN|nr:DUF2218 domain-containing protein [Stackebrandtia albiflava]TWJ15220.1 hypothetical protein LX16_0920 [Stackebrandtia albiflava]